MKVLFILNSTDFHNSVKTISIEPSRYLLKIFYKAPGQSTRTTPCQKKCPLTCFFVNMNKFHLSTDLFVLTK